MRQDIDWTRLQDFFDEADIEWKPIAVSKKTGKGLAAAYISNRAIMDRLDEACGPANWRNEFSTGPGGGVLCGLSIRVGDEWVTKWDGAENTDIEAVKGGLSNSMRRAAVQWGIGRYLYRMPTQWVPVDERGRFVKAPRVPAVFLPQTSASAASPSGASTSTASPSGTSSPGTSIPSASSSAGSASGSQSSRRATSNGRSRLRSAAVDDYLPG